MHDTFTSEEQRKKAIIAMLIRLKKADREEAPQEWAYIQKIGWSFGLKNEDINEVYNQLDSYPLSPPQTEKERMTILYYLLFFMRIDGQIAVEEENLVKEFGFTLGFRTALTTDLIQVIKKHADANVPPAEMIKTIAKYLN